MGNIVQAVASDLVGATKLESAVAAPVANVVSVATGAATAVEDVAGGAVKLATGAVSGILTGFLPYILGICGTVMAGLSIALFWAYNVTIPGLKADAATARANEATANSQTIIANNSVKGLQTALDDANGKLERLAQQCRADDAYADLAADTVRAIAIPAGHSADTVNQFSALVFAKVKP
jgi:hypothetical protein